jgi:hypothetical protein
MLEEGATRTILGEPSAMPAEDRIFDVLVAGGTEGAPAVVRGAAKTILRKMNLLPHASEVARNKAAVEAAGRLRGRAGAKGIPKAGTIQLGLGETGAPLFQRVVSQIRAINSGPAAHSAERGEALHTLVSRASEMSPADHAAYEGMLREQLDMARKEGIDAIRTVARVRAELPFTEAAEASKVAVKAYRSREMGRILPMYTEAARALRDTGASLHYDSTDVMRSFNDARGIRSVPVQGGFRDLAGDLPEPLEEMQRQIAIATQRGWPERSVNGVIQTPEEQIQSYISQLGSMNAAYKTGSSQERIVAHHLNDLRKELIQMLDNPVVRGGDPAAVAAAKQMYRSASDEMAAFRRVMDRLQEQGLDLGDRAATFFEKATAGGGVEEVSAIQGVPELRELALGYYTGKAAKNPEQWADQVIGTRDDVFLELLGGDNPGNRKALAELKRVAMGAKVHSTTIERALASEAEPIARIGATLFAPDTAAGAAIANRVRALPATDPARMRTSAAIAAWVYDQAAVKKPNSPPYLDPGRFQRAWKRVEQLGYLDLLSDDTKQILLDVGTAQSKFIGSGGMATGLAAAEAGADVRQQLTKGAAEPLMAGVDMKPRPNMIQTIWNVGLTLGLGEAFGLFITNPTTATILRGISHTADPAKRLMATGAFLGALTRQSLISQRIQAEHAADQRRREQNRPQPAAL